MYIPISRVFFFQGKPYTKKISRLRTLVHTYIEKVLQKYLSPDAKPSATESVDSRLVSGA
jgi:hypothetical protein